MFRARARRRDKALTDSPPEWVTTGAAIQTGNAKDTFRHTASNSCHFFHRVERNEMRLQLEVASRNEIKSRAKTEIESERCVSLAEGYPNPFVSVSNGPISRNATISHCCEAYIRG